MSDERREQDDTAAPDPRSASADEGADEAQELLTIHLTPARLRRDVAIDGLLRGLLMSAVVAAAVFVFVFEGGADTWSAAAVMAVLVVWLMVNSISARVSRELPMIAALVETDPAAAEDRVARAMKRRPLLRWVRLMLSHRLAVLRHRQQRFEDSGRICEAVLRYPLGPAKQSRPHLLLMLAEAKMQLGQASAAYPPLRELHAMPLSLAEQLQRLALQTRYELLIGRHGEAVRDVKRKVELAELMPAAQCGAMHAMLATAADRARQKELGAWLWERAKLLLTPSQLAQIAAGRFGVTATGEPATA